MGGGRVTFSGGIELGETCQKGGLKPVEKTVGPETKRWPWDPDQYSHRQFS